MRKRNEQWEGMEEVVTRYYQYPVLVTRMERDLADLDGQMRELQELMRADALMPSQGIARPESLPAGDGMTSDPVPGIMKAYLQQMEHAQRELFSLRNTALSIRQESSALRREHSLLEEGMAQLSTWSRDILKQRYCYPTHDFLQIAIASDPEIHESTVRYHIMRALNSLRVHREKSAPAIRTANGGFCTSQVRVESRFF